MGALRIVFAVLLALVAPLALGADDPLKISAIKIILSFFVLVKLEKHLIHHILVADSLLLLYCINLHLFLNFQEYHN